MSRLALGGPPSLFLLLPEVACRICFSFFPSLIARHREFQQSGRTRRLVPASRSCTHIVHGFVVACELCHRRSNVVDEGFRTRRKASRRSTKQRGHPESAIL
ncbi:hypothetical protein BDP55DRAFT_27457 [Colletotrichum godetiae]|uniref:Uncharacterized protein n=1 Tax=Colletotrichum godetiae TaxID=1209918 RepID=A0AAJ0F0P4_9PEZI|nr:uncharacterized protein BDP55DRAFT_27457 [Colletotrichum godetiae]KAK1688708.1 hypothetical protein BDP55DRAFT_27457 [Colletotrichum godetiae]